jgi:uncharacterized repeat protein (TIGR01451 family)
VTTVEGLRAESCATTQITAPQLTIAMTGPATAVVGAPINYTITLTNPGNGPATNVILSDAFDAGLEHEQKTNPVELRIGTLAPGETKTVPLILTPRQPGRLVNRVTATADGNLKAQAEHPVTVQLARLGLTKTGPAIRYMDKPAAFDILVSNTGDAPVNNVIVRDQLPPELVFTSATQGGQAVNGQVVWNLGTLQPGEQRPVQVTARCDKLTPRAVNVATATADPGLQARAEAAIEIRGLPAFRMEVVDTPDPVVLGGKMSYKIDVTNQGSLPGNQIVIVATVPNEMRVINANGPSKPIIEGQRVTFPPVDSLAPKQTLHYSIDVEALKVGDVRFQAELRTSTLREPVIEQESTHIIPVEPVAPGTAPAPRSSPPPASPQPAAPGGLPATPVPVPSGPTPSTPAPLGPGGAPAPGFGIPNRAPEPLPRGPTAPGP